MRICLVRPPAVTNTGLKGQIAAPPLGLAYIAAALKQAGHQVTLVDAVGEAPRQYRPIPGFRNAVAQGLTNGQVAERIDPGAELVGVSCMFSVEWPYDRQTIAAVRAALPGVPVVVGGEHATACADYIVETCKDVDYCVLGEGEATIVELCRALQEGSDPRQVPGLCLRGEDGRAQRTGPRKRIRDIDDLPEPDWSLFNIPAYIENDLTWGVDLGGTSMPILASRGCPHRCAFCSSAQMWSTYWRPRDPARVIAEMKKYHRQYGAQAFNFYDLTPLVSKRWMKSFAEALIEENLGFTWQMSSGTRSEAIDDEMARLLMASGCRNLNLAPESGSPALLERFHKQIDLASVMAAIRCASRAGLRVKVNIIYGFPDETWGEALRTLLLIPRLALAGASDLGAFFYVLIPGSEIFDKLRAAGKVELDEEYFRKLMAFTDPGNHICFAEHFSSRQLGALTMSSMALFYGLSYLLRPWRGLRFLEHILSGRSQGSKVEKQFLHAKRKQDAVLTQLEPRLAQAPALIRELRSWSGVLLGRHSAVAPAEPAPAS
jgi:radical SAM superfamily enzyme YgiQ (UPF0313 family)